MSTSYATGQEFQNQPTGLDVANLVPGGTAAQQAAQLAVVLRQASSYADQMCYQRLYAHEATHTAHVHPDPHGRLVVRVPETPLRAVVSAQWRQSSRTAFMAIDTAYIDIFEEFHKYVTPGDYAGLTGWGQPPITVQTTYVAGWANMVLATAAPAGSTTLAVDNTLAVSAGDLLTVYDGASQETVTAASTTADALTLAAPTAYAHGAGVRVSALPDAVTAATIYIAAWIVKERRAGGGFVMQGRVEGLNQNSEDMAMAREMLMPFRVVI